MLLVKFKKNWADEFDVYGFCLMTEAEYLDLKANIPTMGCWFGTNEGWEEGEHSESDFTAKAVTSAEVDTIRSLFGEGWGVFPNPN